MPSEEKQEANSVCLILGCWGNFLETENFSHCHGIENIILKLSDKIKNYHELMNFFDFYKL